MSRDELEQRVQQELRDSEQLDQQINDRLLQARVNALNATSSHTTSFPQRYFLPWGGAVTAAIIAVLIFIQADSGNPQIDALDLAASEDQMIEAIFEDQELYEEMEFYLWLADSGYEG